MDIICAGFGGQGVLTAGLILGKIAMDQGKNVTWIPSYGSEMRGGTANCNLKVSDDRIGSPFIKEIDVLVVMNMPSLQKFEPLVRPGGVIVANTALISDHQYRSDVQVYEVDATNLANGMDNSKGGNIVMLGALAKSGALFDEKVLGQGIADFFAMKGKNNPKNADCFQAGFEQCQARA